MHMIGGIWIQITEQIPPIFIGFHAVEQSGVVGGVQLHGHAFQHLIASIETIAAIGIQKHRIANQTASGGVS